MRTLKRTEALLQAVRQAVRILITIKSAAAGTSPAGRLGHRHYRRALRGGCRHDPPTHCGPEVQRTR
jgi:hypothetical protein